MLKLRATLRAKWARKLDSVDCLPDSNLFAHPQPGMMKAIATAPSSRKPGIIKQIFASPSRMKYVHFVMMILYMLSSMTGLTSQGVDYHLHDSRYMKNHVSITSICHRACTLLVIDAFS